MVGITKKLKINNNIICGYKKFISKGKINKKITCFYLPQDITKMAEIYSDIPQSENVFIILLG